MANWSAASNRQDFLDIFCKKAGYGGPDGSQCVPDGKKQTSEWAFMVGLLAGAAHKSNVKVTPFMTLLFLDTLRRFADRGSTVRFSHRSLSF